MRLIVVGAMMAIAVPAAGGQFIKFDGVKGEAARTGCGSPDIVTGAGNGAGPLGTGHGAGKVSMATRSQGAGMKEAKLTPRKSGGDPKGEAINGGLNRDIIRRIPKSAPPAEARGGVQVAAGDVTGDGRADGRVHKMDSIAVKQGTAASGRPKYGDITLKRGAAAGC